MEARRSTVVGKDVYEMTYSARTIRMKTGADKDGNPESSLSVDISNSFSELAGNADDARMMAYSCLYRCYRANATKDAVSEKEFLEDPGKYVSIIERGEEPKYGESIGFVHSSCEGYECWDGYDTCGEYPCVVVDVVIRRRTFWTSSDSPGLMAFKFVPPDEREEAERKEAERHELNQECVDSINAMLGAEADGRKDEYDRIMEMLGNDSE